jgi:hypothetical protein
MDDAHFVAACCAGENITFVVYLTRVATSTPLKVGCLKRLALHYSRTLELTVFVERSTRDKCVVLLKCFE